MGEQQRANLSCEFWSQRSQDPSSSIYSYPGTAQRATTRLTWELEEGIVELELAGRSRRSLGGPFEEDCWSWESRDSQDQSQQQNSKLEEGQAVKGQFLKVGTKGNPFWVLGKDHTPKFI